MTRLMESAIRAYDGLGWSLFALPFGTKKMTDPWLNEPDDLPLLEGLAGGRMNLAVRLGPRSGYLADVDLDQPGAVLIAPYLLPPTQTMGGHGDTGRERTHYWYVCPDGPDSKASRRYSSPSGGGAAPVTFAELRWMGEYTLLPPSFHPDGDLYAWVGQPADDPLPPPPVPWDSLDRSVREVAAGALLLEVYPEWTRLRSRHYATVALAGCLLGSGWDVARAERFVHALARAGGDEEADQRVANVRSTADRLARGEPMSGWPSLVSFATSERVDRLKRFLGISQGGSGWAAIMGSTPQASGGGNGASPPPPGPAPTAPTRPATAPNPGPVAPVITTAQQAAQQASAQSGRLSHNEVALATAVALHQATPLARDEGHQLYHYDGGVYHSKGTELFLRGRIQQEVLGSHGAEYLSKGIEDEVLHRLLVGTPPLEERPDPWLLNLENGLLDIRTLELRPHDPAVRTTIKLPVAYDPQAACPNILRFCVQVFPADAVAAGVPWEVVALCACPVFGIDKAILLLGEGENGKGIFLDLVQAFVGKANTSAVSLQRIGDDRFATADLRGRLLNLCADLPTKRLEDSGDFKLIVSGETIRAQRKNQPAFDFRPFCRLLFSANNPPESADRSRGYFRRWHIIPFFVTFDPSNPLRRARPEIMAELLTPSEMSGLLNLALPFMAALLSGAEPTVTPSMVEAIEEFIEASDDFGAWLSTQLRADPAGFVPTSQIQARWRGRQERRHMPGLLTGNAIAKAISTLFPKAVRTKPRVGGTGQGSGQAQGQPTALGPQTRGYNGVAWVNPWP